ncbi:TIR domain-containing protein [Flectobacillus rivi]|uniref:TIR domain-containing protein n=1 Tax=Flectobacillus rivi TaxID=2984209 RepID=A0ABT6Z7K3_9BACT|nr:TIR domain-containing protein [Flectobacillus rivi]MDI9876594.1 TIR domain-containing protein [Flectobacillus rivi]
MSRVYKVYVCHSWSHLDDLENLRRLLKERGYFNVVFKEHSPYEAINSSNATYIKQRLKQSILESDIVLGLAGIYSSHSDWIDWEIQTAYENQIPIIGVVPRGQSRISQTILKRSKDNVNWSTESIVEAVRKYSKLGQ